VLPFVLEFPWSKMEQLTIVTPLMIACYLGDYDAAEVIIPFNLHPFHEIHHCSSLCQVTHTPPTRMMITGLISNEPPTNFFGALLRLLISGIHCLNTRMKAKNLILMNHQSQILNLMNHQSSGVPLAIVGADNQVQFFNVD
jgi:hypothetical protein